MAAILRLRVCCSPWPLLVWSGLVWFGFGRAGLVLLQQVLVFDVTLRSFQQMLREQEANELCSCYRKIVRRAAKQGKCTRAPLFDRACTFLCVCARARASECLLSVSTALTG